MAELFSSLPAEKWPAVDADIPRPLGEEVREVPGWPARAPLLTNWSKIPRPSPPMVLVLHAPLALLHHVGALGFAASNLGLIWLYLLGAHLVLFVVLRGAPASMALERAPELGLTYLLLVSSALHGFYDAFPAAAVVWALVELKASRPAVALFAYCLAAALHYRAYMLAPIALVAAAEVIRRRAFTERRNWPWLIGSGLLAVLSLGTFAMVWRALGGLNDENPLHGNLGGSTSMVVFGVLACVVFARARSWLDVLVVLSLWSFIFTVRQVYLWHAVIPCGWALAHDDRPALRTARFVTVLLMTYAVFRTTMWYPDWLVTWRSQVFG